MSFSSFGAPWLLSRGSTYRPPVGMEIGNIISGSYVRTIMPNYCARLTYSYEDCSGVIHAWALRSDQVVVYEHVGNKTEKVHCHVLLTGTSVDKKQLRNVAAGTRLDVKGQERLAFSTNEWDGDHTFITYMSKGKYDSKYTKGFTAIELDEARKAWKEPDNVFKLDKADKKYFEFSQAMFEDKAVWKDGAGVECQRPQFYPLITAARAYVHRFHGGFHKPQNFNTLKNYLREYGYVNNVTIPKGEKPFW